MMRGVRRHNGVSVAGRVVGREDVRVAKFSLRRYDVQAKLSVYVSAASCVFLVGLAVLVVVWNWGEFMHERTITYSSKTLRAPLVYLFGLISFGLGIAGFGLGASSAGQRRNDKPTYSWIGFFLGAVTITASIVLLWVFRKWGFARE